MIRVDKPIEEDKSRAIDLGRCEVEIEVKAVVKKICNNTRDHFSLKRPLVARSVLP